MKRFAVSGMLVLIAGCSGGPLKEMPILEAPPLEEPPPPPPAPPTPAPPEIYGTWVSAALRGPGSATFDRVELLFRRDGVFCAVAVAPDRVRSAPGRFELHDGMLVVRPQDGPERMIEWSFENGALVLREGEQGMVLQRSPE